MTNKNKQAYLDRFVLSSNAITAELIDFLVFALEEDNTMKEYANSFSEDILNGNKTPEEGVRNMITVFFEHYHKLGIPKDDLNVSIN